MGVKLLALPVRLTDLAWDLSLQIIFLSMLIKFGPKSIDNVFSYVKIFVDQQQQATYCRSIYFWCQNQKYYNRKDIVCRLEIHIMIFRLTMFSSMATGNISFHPAIWFNLIQKGWPCFCHWQMPKNVDAHGKCDKTLE